MFSYAQAAKGLAPQTQSSSPAVSTASSETVLKETVAVNEPRTSLHVKPSPPQTDPSAITKSHQAVPAPNSPLPPTDGMSGTVVSMDESTTGSAEGPSLADLSTQISSSGSASGTHEVTHQDSRTRSDESHVAAPGEGSHAKDTDEDWEKVSIPSVTAERELKAAPIPSVNIWQQRRELQDAKARERPTAPSAVIHQPKQRTAQPNAVVDEGLRKTAPDHPQEKPVHSEARRVNSSGRNPTDRRELGPTQVSPKSGPRPGDKDTAGFPSLATNTESWPTPDSNPITEERRKSSITERGEKADAKSSAQKKWIQMPFVPTAKFETQLPPAANARRGGRPSHRGGRGGTAAPIYTNQDKSDASAMPPPPLPHKGGDHDRGRRNEHPRNARASSLPTDRHRNTYVDDAASKAIRYSNLGSREIMDKDDPTQMPKGLAISGEDTGAYDSPSRSSSQNPPAAQAAVHQPNNSRRESSRGAISQTSSWAETNHRGQTPHQQERFKGAGPDGSHSSTDTSLNRTISTSRTRGDGPSREKGDSWRERREPRSDRGRGSYRGGRGNHLSYNSQSFPYSAPLAQNGFDIPSPTTGPEGRSRQGSQHFPSAQVISNGRGNPRSQSIPLGIVGGGNGNGGGFYSPMQGFPPAMSPLQTDMGFGGGFPSPMQSGIMNHMPYAEPLNSFALISMVNTQLEYYFSIDNLCKDMFLRRHMDSQGFVPLNVIAGFKRIKALTEGQISHEQFRNVCQQVRNIDFVTTESGEDKLRSRGSWKDFVLPVEDRFQTAQNEGPSGQEQLQSLSHQQQSLPPTQVFAEPPISNGPLRSPTAHINGFGETFHPQMGPVGISPIAPFDGQSREFVPRSEQFNEDSTTSPLNKLRSPTQGHARRSSAFVSNGHRRSPSHAEMNENAFPDDKIPELKVVVKDPAFENGTNGETGVAAGPNQPSGVRGGRGSPEQLPSVRNIQFGQSAASPSPITDPDQPPYWSKDGKVTKIPVGPGLYHEDYLPLHDKALNQRSDGHFDGALAVLYAFWSSFLVEHFNLSMYQEFVNFTTEDLQNGNEIGRNFLVRYYEALLLGHVAVTERIATDMVRLARQEPPERRPMCHKLRNAWRNGATNLKTRKRLGDLLTANEKTEFDKSG